MPPVTKSSLGYRVDPVQLLTLAETLSLSMPEGALQRWRVPWAAQESVLERAERKQGQNITRNSHAYMHTRPHFVENCVYFLELVVYKNTSKTDTGALVFCVCVCVFFF